ncbi:hypothetical protein TWF694_003337 [Orbilia ellipsospora]|uniref:Ankyrin repeat protein n=1 Tax=Orbilia ellipsospora TaxID=2528407 RepID=A0AAV9X172_9PEZI
MITYLIALLGLSIPVFGASSWDDFANNFATDLAPIVALFGEQVTKQYLSESTTILDSLTFALAPLGILTAIVSVIRVRGNARVKAFIGRAQEAHGVAEAELCSSTSRDVCELWSNGGISRIFGRPKIIEFFHSSIADFYPQFLSQHKTEGVLYPTCGIKTAKSFLCPEEFSSKNERSSTRQATWEEVPNRNRRSSNPLTMKLDNVEDDSNNSELSGSSHFEALAEVMRFAPHPNLSLNIGIRPVPSGLLWLVFVFGALLQSSFFGYALWATYYAPYLWDNAKPPQSWAFPLVAVGTGLLVIGMGLCAILIDRCTHERRFRELGSSGEKHSLKQPKTTIFWLQPGNQYVGDQVFDAFAYWEHKKTYVTSWKVDKPPQLLSTLAIWPALGFTSMGFVFQFVGLRGLHGSVALYQLVSTLIMALIRAAIRSKRIDEEKNLLKGRRDVEGHELDWLALQIDRIFEHNREIQNDPDGLWYIVDLEPSYNPENSLKCGYKASEVDTLNWQDITGFVPKENIVSDSDVIRRIRTNEILCAESAVRWIELYERDLVSPHPNKAAKVLRYRSRLAELTHTQTLEEANPWDTQVRKMADKLGTAIEAAVTYIFSSGMKISRDWRNAQALVVSSTVACCAYQSKTLDLKCYPICLLLYRNNGRWVINKHELESVLGLWQWSLKAAKNSYRMFNKKAFLVTETSKKESLMATMSYWIARRDHISVDYYSSPFPASESRSVLSVPALSFAKDKSADEILLLATTTASQLQLLAQDIFTLFTSKLMGIIEPLEDVGLRSRNSQEGAIYGTNLKDSPFLGLTEPNIEALCERFIVAGLGTREDAMMSIIPSLLQKQKLPFQDETVRRLVRTAQLQRRNGDFQKCESTLAGLLQLQTPSVEKSIVRSFGELYRFAIRSYRQADRELARRVKTKIANMLCHTEEAKHMRQIYGTVAQYIQDPNHASPIIIDTKNDKTWKELADELYDHDHDHEVRPFGLLLTAKYDVSRAHLSLISDIIMWAIKNNCPELIEDLWESARSQARKLWNGSTPQNEDRGHFRLYAHQTKDSTPLIWAIKNKCDLETFQSILDWPDADIERPDSDGATALLIAAEGNLVGQVRALLEAEVNTGARDQRDNYDALEIAAANGHKTIIDLLLPKRDAKSDDRGPENSALHAAAAGGQDVMVDWLLDKGADVNSLGRKYGTALQGAAVKGCYEVAKMLISKGANVNATIDDPQDGQYRDALQAAVAMGEDDIVRLLLDSGAEISAGTRRIAREGGEENIISLLGQIPCDNCQKLGLLSCDTTRGDPKTKCQLFNRWSQPVLRPIHRHN